MDIEDEVLEDGFKTTKVNCQRNVTDDCVTDGGDACCWVGFVVLSELFFSYFCRCESALAVKILVALLEVELKIGHGGGQLMVISSQSQWWCRGMHG